MNINVAELSNIPKFSKLDEIVTLLRLLQLFFDDILVDMIVGYTKLYSHREKADASFEITNEKIRLCLSMLLLSECHKLSDCKMYCETTPNTFAYFSSIFERVLRSPHPCYNKQLGK